MVRRLIIDFILGAVALIMALDMGLPLHADAATKVDTSSEVEEPERQYRSYTALEWMFCSGRTAEHQPVAEGEGQVQAQLAHEKRYMKPSTLLQKLLLYPSRDAERQPVAQGKAMEPDYRRPPAERRYGYNIRLSKFFFLNLGPERQVVAEEEVLERDYRPITLFDLMFLSARPNERARLAGTESFQQKYLVRRHR